MSEIPPSGKRHPITSTESQVYIDTGEWPDDVDPDEDEDDGCPKNDPDCLSLNGECHDACETPDETNERLVMAFDSREGLHIGFQLADPFHT